MLLNFAPKCITLGDKKSLKGQELYFHKVYTDPETGIVPPLVA